jgi:glucose-6-phosphate 1-dehydrogenase
MEVRDITMDFQYGEAFTESSPEAYERLVLDVLLGDSTLFPHADEVEASWRVVDPLERAWAGTCPSLPGRRVGPAAADEMLAATEGSGADLIAAGRACEDAMIALWDTLGALRS